MKKLRRFETKTHKAANVAMNNFIAAAIVSGNSFETLREWKLLKI